METNHDYEEIIEKIVRKRSQYRRKGQWEEADNLKTLLEEQHGVDVFDADGFKTTWKLKTSQEEKMYKVVWSLMDGACLGDDDVVDKDHDSTIDWACSGTNGEIPLFIATVDSPYYKSRLQETLHHLQDEKWGSKSFFGPIAPLHMLDLAKNPAIGSQRIVYEGWYQNVLSKLSEMVLTEQKEQEAEEASSSSFFLIAEDDVRLPPSISPKMIRDICLQAFTAHPDLQILSLGHAYSPTKSSRKQKCRARQAHQRAKRLPTPSQATSSISNNKAETYTSGSNAMEGDDDGLRLKVSSSLSGCSLLLQHLQTGGGIHGATLLAIRSCAVEDIRIVMGDPITLPPRKRSHFDQYLFHSASHNIQIAVSDPPIVGWGEVSQTLTSVGSGYRRKGGGRLQHLPPTASLSHETDKDSREVDTIKWIRRQLVRIVKD